MSSASSTQEYLATLWQHCLEVAKKTQEMAQKTMDEVYSFAKDLFDYYVVQSPVVGEFLKRRQKSRRRAARRIKRKMGIPQKPVDASSMVPPTPGALATPAPASSSSSSSSAASSSSIPIPPPPPMPSFGGLRTPGKKQAPPVQYEDFSDDEEAALDENKYDQLEAELASLQSAMAMLQPSLGPAASTPGIATPKPPMKANPPPPPPPPPMMRSAAGVLPSSIVRSSNIGAGGSVPPPPPPPPPRALATPSRLVAKPASERKVQFEEKKPLTLADVMKSGTPILLRKVDRRKSPGGTPGRSDDFKQRASKNANPQDELINALRKKFKSVEKNSPSSPKDSLQDDAPLSPNSSMNRLAQAIKPVRLSDSDDWSPAKPRGSQ